MCRDGTMHAAALLAGETQYKVWTQLKETLRPGAPTGFERIFRKPLFAFLAEHEEAYAVFNAAMEARVKGAREALVAACEVRGGGEMIVDVGGGTGSVLRALLEKHTEARGTLLETAAVIEAARGSAGVVGGAGDAGGGDCLEAVPTGDVMVLVTVLHMFQDEGARRILRNCRAGLRPGGTGVYCGGVAAGAEREGCGEVAGCEYDADDGGAGRGRMRSMRRCCGRRGLGGWCDGVTSSKRVFADSRHLPAITFDHTKARSGVAVSRGMLKHELRAGEDARVTVTPALQAAGEEEGAVVGGHAFLEGVQEGGEAWRRCRRHRGLARRRECVVAI